MKKGIYERTKKGNELLKIVNALQRFKKKYPKKISQALEFVGIYDDKAVRRVLNKIVKGTKYSPLSLGNFRTEKEIRARIRELDKLGRRKFNPKNDKEATKMLIQTYIRLGERYSLWWVLKEVRKHQGRSAIDEQGVKHG